jgi:hypothetical protein
MAAVGLVAACVVGSGVVFAQGQGRPNAPQRPLASERATPAEIQQLFDAMVVMRAEQTLKLGEEQYAQFLTRLKALQDVRRRAERERMRVLQELRKMVQAADAALDDRIVERLNALNEADVRAASDVRKAMEELDAVLEPRQRAMFRFLEEQIERQKVELLLRARQMNRATGRF